MTISEDTYITLTEEEYSKLKKKATKAKRWKRKYLSLLGSIKNIKRDIRSNNIADFIAVQSVLDIINKHVGDSL